MDHGCIGVSKDFFFLLDKGIKWEVIRWLYDLIQRREDSLETLVGVMYDLVFFS